MQWHIKSTTKAQQGLYEYDAVSRLRDSQLGDAHVADIAHYIKHGVLWEAFESDEPAVVLIDEIDKADIEFPNDLLRELDRMEFYVYETHETIRRRTGRSSSSRRTTRRNCRTHSCAAASSTTSASPTATRWSAIVDVHYPGLKKALLRRRSRCSSTCARCRD